MPILLSRRKISQANEVVVVVTVEVAVVVATLVTVVVTDT